jgi:hypothetical protein
MQKGFFYRVADATSGLHASVSSLTLLLVLATGWSLLGTSQAAADGWRFEAEGGAIWFGRNDVRIPGDTGTRFDMRDLTGDGPDPYFRLAAEYSFGRHSFRGVAAPLRVSGTGTLMESVQFAGETFAAGLPARGVYQFDNYRLTYRYTMRDTGTWGWGLGAVVFVRDAKVELSQGDTTARDTDVGFVPLAHISAWNDVSQRVTLRFELEGLAASQGRAFDGSIIVDYRPADNWSIGVGYRALEGGVDNDDVYSFALVHHAVVSIRRRL